MTSALGGWARVQHGEHQEGIEELEKARAALATTGARVFSTYVLAFLSEAHLRAGDVAGGLAAADEALRVAETTLDRSHWAELWRLKGELLLAAQGAERHTTRRGSGAGAASATAESTWRRAEKCLSRALELARTAEAKSLELRAATSLARAWHARGQPADARAVLGSICEWFGAGATSPDLLEARSLLEQLSMAPRSAPRAPRRRTTR